MQDLAASFLFKLAKLEEGRRYLRYTSKITNDIKKVLRTKGRKLEQITVDTLRATLNMIHPQMTQNVNFAHYSRQNDEGKQKKIPTETDNCTQSTSLLESPRPCQKDSGSCTERSFQVTKYCSV